MIKNKNSAEDSENQNKCFQKMEELKVEIQWQENASVFGCKEMDWKSLKTKKFLNISGYS